MRIILRLFTIFRLHNIAAAVLAVAAGFSVGGAEGVPLILLVAVAITTAAGNVINDYYDSEIDRVNKPNRALPSGVLSKKQAFYLYIILLVFLVFIFVLLEPVVIVWIITWVVLLHLYSLFFKRWYIIGNLIVSFVTGTGFLLGSYCGGNIKAGVLPALFTFFFIFAREIVKDCEDIEGDYFFGLRTIAIVLGKIRAMKVAAVIFLLLIFAFPMPYFIGTYSRAYFFIIIFSIIPILFLSFMFAFKGKRPGFISILLKVGIFFGIIAFYYAV
ncbi:geranylgeranylglycerol-phosphate geranylgeranyltransferase [bacterium]|nr:geranylgeranylglycerol-phosphate geranylgeranyltransferase [bacterium]